MSESSIKAFVIPRIKLNDVKNRPEVNQPALYFLISSDRNQLYIGESENFFHRVKNHDQSKDFWDVAIAIVSNTTNPFEKSDVKYLESLAVEKALQSAAMDVLNKTVPVRNNVHEFKIHTLEKFLEDAALVAELLGYSVFAKTKDDSVDDKWHCRTKLTDAQAEFRGDKFIVLAGSVVDKSVAPSWAKSWPKSVLEREEIFAKYGDDLGDRVRLRENVPFKSPNHAGGFLTGRNVNAWTTFTDGDGRTMDEVIRRGVQDNE